MGELRIAQAVPRHRFAKTSRSRLNATDANSKALRHVSG